MTISTILGPMTGIAVIGLVTQQTGVNISTELLISILVNVAIIALAFGRIQANVGHIKETMDKLEEHFDKDMKRIENRVERVASRYHQLANDLFGRRAMDNENDKDSA